MIITFSGPSGAGKTTLIAELLKSKFFFDKKVVIKNEDDFLVINLTKRILGESIFTRYKDEWYFNKRDKDYFYKLFKLLAKFFYPLVVYIEFLVFYFYYEILFEDKVLITDRFIYDHEVSFRTLMKINNPIFTWLYSNFPRTYLSFIIIINLENAALKRNRNNRPGANTSTKVFHKKVLAMYKQISVRENLLVIDNNSNLKRTVNQLLTHLENKEKLLSIREISLCGMDGAGKTTIANNISNYANTLNIQSGIAHFVHNNIIYKLLLRFGMYEGREELSTTYKRKRELSLKERQKQTPFILALLRFIDSYIQYLYYKIIYMDKLIIFDRYFYDYVVSFEYLNIRPRAFFLYLIPDVKNKFIIQSNPSTSYNRKPERVKEFFSDNYKIYKKVAKSLNIKIINTEKLNSEQAFAQVLKNIK